MSRSQSEQFQTLLLQFGRQNHFKYMYDIFIQYSFKVQFQKSIKIVFNKVRPKHLNRQKTLAQMFTRRFGPVFPSRIFPTQINQSRPLFDMKNIYQKFKGPGRFQNLYFSKVSSKFLLIFFIDL